MSEWVRINPAKFNRPRRENIRGAAVEMFASPYEVPSAMRGGIDHDSGNYILEFKYIGGDEPLFIVEPVSDLKLTLGRNSRRIFKLELAPKATGVKTTVHDVMLALDRTISDLTNKENYNVAKLVVKDRAEKLAAAAG